MLQINFSSLSDKELAGIAAEKLAGKLDEWERNIWQFVSDWFNHSVSSIKVFTSGATGSPKQILHGKGSVLNSAMLTSGFLHLKQNDKMLLCLPANKIAGMMVIVRCIWKKMDLYYMRPSAHPLLRIPDKEKFDVASFTPMQLFGVGNDRKMFMRLQKIRKLLIGGENISERLINVLQRMDNEAYATFGMTETISHIALRRINGKHPESYFKTLGSITVSADERKCLVIEAPELGVHRLVTNDVVHLISPTEFEWLGRRDNLINSGGVKVYPEQIEEQLKPLLDFPFFITGIDNTRTGQEVAIAIEKRSFTLKDANDLKKRFAALGKLCTPKAILPIAHFTRTENGKINRKDSLLHTMARIAI